MTDKQADKYAALSLFYCKVQGLVRWYDQNPILRNELFVADAKRYLSECEAEFKKIEGGKQ